MNIISPNDLIIPPTTTTTSLIVRHSFPVPDGDTFAKTLTPEGVELCHKVRNFYSGIVKILENFFDPATYWSSMHLRSTLSVWEIFQAQAIARTALLNVSGDLPGWEGFIQEKESGRSTVDIIAEFVQGKWQEAPDSADFATALHQYHRFAVANPRPTKLTIGVAHEVGISLLSHKLGLRIEALGMKECQGVVIFMDDSDHVIGIEKLTPAPTT